MADLTISFGAEEDVSSVMKKLGEAAAKLGDDNAAAAKKTKSEWDHTVKAFKDGGDKIAVSAKEIERSLTWLAGKAFEFGKSAITAFAEQEKADKQLASALKQLGHSVDDLLPKMKEMASEFQQTLGVSDDMVEGIQSMLIRFGVAPEKIKPTISAILDYATATGVDAEQATFSFMRALENGGKGLGRMGISIDVTGDKAKDLDSVVVALGEKFGGSALANANTFGGSMAKMGEQFEELKEAMGGFLVQLETKLGLMQKVNTALSSWNYLMSDEKANLDATVEKEEKKQAADKKVIDLQGNIKADQAFVDDPANARFAMQVRAAKGRIETMQKLLVLAREERALLDHVEFTRTGGRGEGGGVGYRGVVEFGEPIFGKPKKVVDPFAAPKAKKSGGGDSQFEDEGLLAFAETLKQNQEHFEDLIDAKVDAENELTRVQEEGEERRLRLMRETAKEERKINDEREREAMETQQAIFAALADAFADQLQDMRGGEEFSAEEFAKALVPALIAMGVDAYAPGAGRLAGMAAGLGMDAIFSSAKGHHDGGWVREPEYHAGGRYAGEGNAFGSDTVPAWLTPGERVLSPTEIANMGGREGVERAVRGGNGGNTFIKNEVHAIDALSLEDTFSRRGGSALARVTNKVAGEFGQQQNRMRRGR